MNTKSLRHLPATLCAATLLLPLTALAAPGHDPKVAGHWRGTFPGSEKNKPTVDLILQPSGTETMTVNVPKHPIVFHATYVTTSGVLIMTRVLTPAEAKTDTGNKVQKLKYTVTPTTLILDDGTPTGRVLFHRVSG